MSHYVIVQFTVMYIGVVESRHRILTVQPLWE